MNGRPRLLLPVGALAILMVAAGIWRSNLWAQTPPAVATPSSLPMFEVVSIRPVRDDDPTPNHITNSAHNGYLKAVNVNLKALMEVAYDIPDLRMYGGPDWLTTAKFNLEAKADPAMDDQIAALSPAEAKQVKRKMLTALLTDQFQLKVHTETRDMPVYAMVATKDGFRCGKGDSGACAGGAGEERIKIRAGSDSLEILAYELSWRLGRPVLDRTGTGYHGELILSWQDSDASADTAGPSLFTAMKEQLGLKVEATRGAVPVLVIDHADRPSEN